MNNQKKIKLLYGKEGIELSVPQSADILEVENIPRLENFDAAILESLKNPIGSASLEQLLRDKKPKKVAITISDITRPVPNKQILPQILDVINRVGISDSQIVIIIGTGMHSPSTPEEREILVGSQILNRIEVIDHTADKPETLVKVKDEPPVYLCRRFAESDFKIVTGFIEPHFMAGFSGGRKGVCPALVDLRTVQRFHGYQTLSNLNATNGNLDGNPCHEIALEIARIVKVDFLVNVALTGDKEIAGVYSGDIEKAHQKGCEQVSKWTTIHTNKKYDLVVTCGGGYPLDQNFYQTTKGICGALPVLDKKSQLLVLSCCDKQLGSDVFTDIMLKYGKNWQKFLSDISKNNYTILDQWGMHMHTRVLERIGIDNLFFISDGIHREIQKKIAVTPVLGLDNAQIRAQKFIDDYILNNPDSTIAIIPDGPYTMLKS
jgi:nickel-dependent lactate racemase